MYKNLVTYTTIGCKCRYKLHLCVMDSSGDTKLMNFDNFAVKLIGRTATELLDGRVEEVNIVYRLLLDALFFLI